MIQHDLVHPVFDKELPQTQQMKHLYAVRIEGYNLHMLELGGGDLIASHLGSNLCCCLSVKINDVFLFAFC